MKYIVHNMHQFPSMLGLRPGMTYKVEEFPAKYLGGKGEIPTPSHGDKIYLIEDERVLCYTIVDTSKSAEVAAPTSAASQTIADSFGSRRIRNCLTHPSCGGVDLDWQMKTLADVAMRTEDELLSIDNFGQHALTEVKHVLLDHGLRLKPGEALLAQGVESLKMSVRTTNCLKAENIMLIGDLTEKSQDDLLKMPSFGRRGVNEIKETFAKLGLSLKS